jgi:glycosyltransferase involved in cell wall biosynthesis
VRPDAGATSDDTPFIERYARERLGPNVTILKDQPPNAMPSIYQAMDLLVHPAPEEVFGLCLIEAMACGIPVVAHASPRLRYVVGDGGWLTDVRRPGFLAELWPAVTADLAFSSARAREHVERRFSWAAVYPQFMKMYRAVVEQMPDRGMSACPAG